jgi:hypothetical protein
MSGQVKKMVSYGETDIEDQEQSYLASSARKAGFNRFCDANRWLKFR